MNKNYMLKDFNTWIEKKKSIHDFNENKFYKYRELWWCALGINVGFEEDGKGQNSERPVLILRGFNRHLCWIIPLTTIEKKNPFYVSIGTVDQKRAFVIISQLRLIDTKRLIDRIGHLDKKYFEIAKQAVKDIL